MAAIATETGFIVWGIDQTAYGPVELPTLVSWVKDERVTADTWIYAAKNSSWQKAADVPELQMFFRSTPAGAHAGTAAMTTPTGVDPRAMRRIKILGGMTDDQLERFAQFVEAEKVPQWSVIVKQGDPGNSMYFILEGELRARINVMGNETILATLSAGDFFGDISLFDRYLTMPVRVPDYRRGRDHGAFCTTLAKEGYAFPVGEAATALDGVVARRVGSLA